MFGGAFLVTVVFYAAFGAFILNFVEFLTGVWHYSAVEAGLAIAPGPLMVLPAAKLVAPLAAKFGGPGRVAVFGCFVLVAAMVLWYFRIQAAPAFLTHLLPCQVLGGIVSASRSPQCLPRAALRSRRTGSARAAAFSTWPVRSAS
jgi:MFS-type transporter involved in bile tolerance (Atg22 family)